MGRGDRKKAKPLPALKVKPPRRPKRAADGRFCPEEGDNRETALAARTRRTGARNTKEARLQHTAEYFSDDIGICIHAVTGSKTREQREETSELWKVWTGFCASRWQYRRRILGMSGFPKGMDLKSLPEVYQTDQSHSVDLRTEEERDEAAKRSYALWNARVGQISNLEYQSLLHSAENGHVPVLNRNADGDVVPSPRGVNLVRAIEALRDVINAEG